LDSTGLGFGRKGAYFYEILAERSAMLLRSLCIAGYLFILIPFRDKSAR